MATLRKNADHVICIRLGNDQPQARRLFASTHRAKVLQMPRVPVLSEPAPIRRRLVNDRLFNTDRLAWALSIADLHHEQYEAMLAVRDSFSNSRAVPSGTDQILRGLECQHIVKSLARGCCPIHGGCPVAWQLTMAGEAILSAIDIMLGKGPPPPKPTHRAIALQMSHAVGKRAA